MRLGSRLTTVIGFCGALGACAGGEEIDPEEAAVLDSAFHPDKVAQSTSIRERLDLDDEQQLVAEAQDPTRIISDFYKRLSPASGSVPLTADELGDTVFLYLPPISLIETQTQFIWGALSENRMDSLANTIILPCKVASDCGAQAMRFPGGALRNPSLVAVSRPAVEDFLARPLLVPGYPNAILEVQHSDANPRIARAVCINGIPTIQYATNLSPNTHRLLSHSFEPTSMGTGSSDTSIAAR